MLGFRRSSSVGLLQDNAEMFDAIVREAGRAAHGLRRVRLCVFNGGASLEQLLSRVSPYLAQDFTIEILVWDNCSARLSTGGSPVLEELSQEMARIDRALRAYGAYPENRGYSDFSELACEYLLLASQILTVPARHQNHLDQIEGTLNLGLKGAVSSKNGSVIVRKSPNYPPGRLFMIDEQAFLGLYTHSGRSSTIIQCRAGHALFDRLADHFEAAWDGATGSVAPPMGRNADEEAALWAERETTPELSHPTLFLNYRRADSGWAAGRLYDRLAAVYTKAALFLDHQSLETGRVFPAEIASRIGSSDVVIVFIGPQWLSMADDVGGRRIDNPDDWVAREIEEALRLEKKIVTIFLDGAEPPAKSQLPSAIAGLADIHSGLKLRFDHFDEDAGRILSAVQRFAPPVYGAPR